MILGIGTPRALQTMERELPLISLTSDLSIMREGHLPACIHKGTGEFERTHGRQDVS